MRVAARSEAEVARRFVCRARAFGCVRGCAVFVVLASSFVARARASRVGVSRKNGAQSAKEKRACCSRIHFPSNPQVHQLQSSSDAELCKRRNRSCGGAWRFLRWPSRALGSASDLGIQPRRSGGGAGGDRLLGAFLGRRLGARAERRGGHRVSLPRVLSVSRAGGARIAPTRPSSAGGPCSLWSLEAVSTVELCVEPCCR